MDLTTRPNDVLTVATQTDKMLTLATSIVKSGLIPNAIKTPEAALGVLLKGRELGLAPMQSFDCIDVIQGKPTLKPQAMLALIYASPAFGSFEVNESTTDACTVTMSRKGGKPHTETFSMADAKALGLSGKDNWKKMPATMLKWRAVSACARVVFPDVIQGMYMPEEIEGAGPYETPETPETPEVIDVAFQSANAPEDDGGTLTKELASRLHRALGGMGFKGHQQTALASAVAGRQIESFTTLTREESKAVHAAGSTIADGSATPADYGIAIIEWEGPLEELPA